jgi:hypothetical protein
MPACLPAAAFCAVRRPGISWPVPWLLVQPTVLADLCAWKPASLRVVSCVCGWQCRICCSMFIALRRCNTLSTVICVQLSVARSLAAAPERPPASTWQPRCNPCQLCGYFTIKAACVCLRAAANCEKLGCSPWTATSFYLPAALHPAPPTPLAVGVKIHAYPSVPLFVLPFDGKQPSA